MSNCSMPIFTMLHSIVSPHFASAILVTPIPCSVRYPLPMKKERRARALSDAIGASSRVRQVYSIHPRYPRREEPERMRSTVHRRYCVTTHLAACTACSPVYGRGGPLHSCQRRNTREKTVCGSGNGNALLTCPCS